MPEADRCSLNIPFPSWARDNPNTPELDYQNWLEVMRWADRYHREQCGGGAGGSMTIDLGEAAPLTGYTRILYPMVDGELERVVGSLAVVDNSVDTVAEVVRWDGAVAHSLTTVTIPAGDSYVSVDVGEDFGETEGWQMRITQVGTDAQGLSYNGKFT